MLKILIAAAAIAIIGYIGYTLYNQDSEDARIRLSQSVALAKTERRNLNTALTEVRNTIAQPAPQSIPAPAAPQSVAAPAITQSIPAPAAPQSVAAPAITQSIPAPAVSQGIAAPPAPQNVPAAPAIATPIPTATPVVISQITDIDLLVANWEPRYNSAVAAHASFTAAIANAKAAAEGYFSQQEELTEQYQTDAARQKAVAQDVEDRRLYAVWETKADAALEKSENIMAKLSDMNLTLQKIELRESFAFDPNALTEVVAPIQDLNADLGDFEIASDNIRVQVGSPFQAQ